MISLHGRKEGFERVEESIPDCTMTTPPFELKTRHSSISPKTCFLTLAQLVIPPIICESGPT